MSTAGLQTTFHLVELGTDFLAQRLRRDNPDISEKDIAAAVADWLANCSQSPDGDAMGKRGTWPRKH